MKNKVLVAMGIGIAAAMAPVALNSVDANAQEVDPIVVDDQGQEVPTTNEEKVETNNETVEKMQEQQADNQAQATTDNEETKKTEIADNETAINGVDSSAVDSSLLDEVNQKGQEVVEKAKDLDDANKDLQEQNENLTESEEKLKNNDGSNPSEYNDDLDDVNENLNPYNDAVYNSQEKDQALKDASDKYDEALGKLEEDINDKLDKQSVDSAKDGNKNKLDTDADKVTENAGIGNSNEDILAKNEFTDTTKWHQDLTDGNGKKYSESLASAKSDVEAAGASLGTAKDGLDTAKGALDAAKGALDAAEGSKEYNEKLAAYKAAEATYNGAVDTYNSAKSAYDTAKGSYDSILADYVKAENAKRLEEGVETVNTSNLQNIPDADTSATLTANDGKLLNDITAASVDEKNVAEADKSTVADVQSAVNILDGKKTALSGAESALKSKEEALNAAKKALQDVKASAISKDDYNKLVADAKKAEDEYKAAVEAYDSAVGEYNKAASDLVAKYNKYIEAKNKKAAADKDSQAVDDNNAATDSNELDVANNRTAVSNNTKAVNEGDLSGLMKEDWLSKDDKGAMQGSFDAWTGAKSALAEAATNFGKAENDLETAKNKLLNAMPADNNYAALVEDYNAKVDAYNEKLDTYNKAVNAYNNAASAFVDKYNALRKAQQGKYDEAEKAKVTPLDALRNIASQAKTASGVEGLTAPSEIIGKNNTAVGTFEAEVKAAFKKELPKMTDDQINSIFDTMYSGKIGDLNTKAEELNGEWTKLNAEAGKVQTAAETLNAAKKAIDDAAKKNNITEAEFEKLKKAYNDAVTGYKDAVGKYAEAKKAYDGKVDAYNKAAKAIFDFDKSYYLASGGNYAKIDADVASIGSNDSIMAENFKKLGIEGENPDIDKLMKVITADDAVAEKYYGSQKTELKKNIQLLMNGLNNTVKVDGVDVTISNLQNKIREAAAKLSDEDGATDADVAKYNKLVSAYVGFIDSYNSAKDAYNAALQNYTGKTVSQYKESEKDTTPSKVVKVYNDNPESGHIDAKVDGAVSIEEKDGKWVIKEGGNYEILGVYASQDAAEKYGQKGVSFKYETTEGTGWNKRTVEKSGTENIGWYNDEFSFAGASGQYNNSLKDSNGKTSVGTVKVTSATIWVNYKVGDETKIAQEFTISSDARFKENTWFAGEDSDKLKMLLPSKKVETTEWTIDNHKFDSMSTEGWVKKSSRSYFGTTYYWERGNITLYVDPTNPDNWTSKTVTKDFYDVSGCNIFEISKYICSNNSGLDLVLSLEVLQDLKDRKELKDLETLNNGLTTVTANKEEPDTPSGTIKANLENAIDAPEKHADAKTVDAKVVKNTEKNPGAPANKPVGPTASLKEINDRAVKPGTITPDERRADFDDLKIVGARSFDPLKDVNVDDVTGKNMNTISDMSKISGSLTPATPDTIKLTRLNYSGPSSDGFVVAPLFKLALPTPPTPPTPPVTPPTGGGDDDPDVPAGGPATPVLAAAPIAPAAPAVGGPAVLGARRDGGQVLGAKRGVDKAVLGKKRTAATGDSMAVFGWISALMTTLGGAGAAAGALKKSKKEEDAE